MTMPARGLFLFLMVGVSAVLFGTSLGSILDSRGQDLWQTGHAPHPDIAIIAIDNQSLAKLGRWPWPRALHAQILERLALAHPAAVGIDITFSEAESVAADQALALAIGQIPAPVILAGQAVTLTGQTAASRVIQPIDRLRSLPNVRVGLINVDLDPDSLARQLPQARTIDGANFEPFGGLLAQTLNARLPATPVTIDFAGRAGTFPTYPAASLLDGSLNLDLLRDRIVLIGATASDLHDTVLAPVPGGIMSGVEWNANVADNLLLKRYRSGFPRTDALVVALFLSLVGFLLFVRAPAHLTWWIFGALALALPAASFVFWRIGWNIPFATTLMILAVLASFHGVLRYLRAEADKRRLRTAFTPYFAPQVMEAILKDPDSVKLGGERRVVTVFFSDIRNFTTMSESLPPERLTKLLSEYFEAMTEELFATEGVLSEFVGDGIVAFWGAPIEQPDHANRAVTTALRMFDRLRALRPKWEAESYPTIDIGIGINTGEAIVGNTGSSKRFDYAAIGDTTNAASRIEGLNKEYKTHILISEATKRQLTIPVKTRTIGDVKVKGKTVALRIHEVLLTSTKEA